MNSDWLWDHLLFDELAMRCAMLLDQFRASALDPSKRLSIWPVLTTVAIAAFVFVRQRRRSARLAGTSFWSFLVPRSILRHPSSRLDLKIMLLNAVAKPGSIVVAGLTVVGFATLLAEGLDAWLGESRHQMNDSWGAMLLLGVAIFLITDLSTYIVHRLSHEWPLLWSFHRVHHSAPVMNPLTQQRRHPVSIVLARVADLLIVAPPLAILLYFWNEEAGPTVALIVRWCFSIFALIGGNLRHSHIWLSFGRFERLFVSPAQHQIHHSRAERHWNCNYGEVLAIWDWMFGTLHVAKRPERLRFGLNEAKRQPHVTLKDAVVEPFLFAYRLRRSET